MKFWIAVLLLAAASTVSAQQHHHSPYAGLQNRDVKALSEQQIDDLRAGRGMGLALAAELNDYPGPLHVLEFADQLQLTADQRQRVQQLYDTMKVEAIAVGERIIASEEEMDREFAMHKMTPARLASLTAEIGARQGELRGVHLKYHLVTAELLTAGQRQRYRELRGYH